MHRLFAVAVLVVGLSACETTELAADAAAKVCNFGETEVCDCTPTVKGQRACLSNESSWTACQACTDPNASQTIRFFTFTAGLGPAAITFDGNVIGTVRDWETKPAQNPDDPAQEMNSVSIDKTPGQYAYSISAPRSGYRWTGTARVMAGGGVDVQFGKWNDDALLPGNGELIFWCTVSACIGSSVMVDGVYKGKIVGTSANVPNNPLNGLYWNIGVVVATGPHTYQVNGNLGQVWSGTVSAPEQNWLATEIH